MHVPIPFQEGRYERVESLLSQNRSAVDARCHLTGDTPLIAAARNGHKKVSEGMYHTLGRCTWYVLRREISVERFNSGLDVSAVQL